MKNSISSIPTPFAIICPSCDKVYLTKEEYKRQMNNPNNRWQCPKCGQMPVDWDDLNYEGFGLTND